MSNKINVKLIGDKYKENKKYVSSVLAENGKIYCPPYETHQVLEIDPNTKKTKLIGDKIYYNEETSKPTKKLLYYSGVLANNGNIYCPPYNSDKVLEINPNEGTIKLINIKNFYTSSTISQYYMTGILANNGNIYCPPSGAKNILRINPNEGIAELILNHIGELNEYNKYTVAILANNGKIYCPPYNAKKVLVINTDDYEFFEYIGELEEGTEKYHSCVLAENKKIYCPPYSAKKVLMIDTDINKIETIGADIESDFGGQFKYTSGILAGDGNIYSVPFHITRVLKINPKNSNVYFIGREIDGRKNYRSSVLADNGNIYAPPYGHLHNDPLDWTKVTNRVLEIKILENDNININFIGDKLYYDDDDDDKKNHLYTNSILAGNGNIYAPPYDADKVLEINIPKEKKKDNLGLILGLTLGIIIPILIIIGYFIYKYYSKRI